MGLGPLPSPLHPQPKAEAMWLSRGAPLCPNTGAIRHETLAPMSPKHVEQWLEALQTFWGVGVALVRQEEPEKRAGKAWMEHR